MAGAAGHPDVAHAAAAFGSLLGGGADAGLPADLSVAGPQLVTERAELGPVFENGYRHENDHAQADGISVLDRMRLPGFLPRYQASPALRLCYWRCG